MILDHLYEVNKHEVIKAGDTLADAFKDDPILKKIFDTLNIEKKRFFFEGPIRYCIKYGKVYGSSDQLEGVMAVMPGKYAEMTFGRVIRTSLVFSMFKNGIRFMNKMNQLNTILAPLSKLRETAMGNREYIYLVIIGVNSDQQGQGIGKKMLKVLTDKADEEKVPIYLETDTKKNIAIYESFGFKVVGKIIHPIIDLPQWGMIREAKKL